MGQRLKPKKNYQLFLQGLGIIATPIMIVTMTATLFLGIDVDSYCEWCSYITCVPFPPIETPWWTCDPCEEGTSWDPASPNEIVCPRDIGTVAITFNFTAPTTVSELLLLCQQAC